MRIPWSSLSDAALRGVIEEFATRDGTDYGETEVPLERKVRNIERQLRAGEAEILFDPELGLTTIVPVGAGP